MASIACPSSMPRDMIEEQVHIHGKEKIIGQFRQLLKRMRFWQVDAFALLGTGDAASTALCCGLIDATMNALCTAVLPRGKKGHGLRLKTTPCFDVKTFEIQIHGIFRIRTAQIMLAALNWRREIRAGSR